MLAVIYLYFKNLLNPNQKESQRYKMAIFDIYNFKIIKINCKIIYF